MDLDLRLSPNGSDVYSRLDCNAVLSDERNISSPYFLLG